MRALVFDGAAVRVEERDVPDRAEDEALVRVTLAGICNTDLELTKGYMGFRGTLGHEFVGVAEAGQIPPPYASCRCRVHRQAESTGRGPPSHPSRRPAKSPSPVAVRRTVD
ncbi:MAG: alcohol dehydrogenase catalytic domain-containing protein [Deltaproteobacteria bacterium]|nr:alcohol dehydrogenase catalytic domain-containing protein [Deltaproteobacteria bacterium]